jgi:hypothetical protein
MLRPERDAMRPPGLAGRRPRCTQVPTRAHGLALVAIWFGGLAAHLPVAAQTAPFLLSSPDLAMGTFDGRFVLRGFGCSGGNLSPALEWRNPPPGTRSFALLMHDQDAPTGSGFWHWAVYNIPLSATGLARGAGNTPAALPPPAVGGMTDFHDAGVTGGNGNYGGPCPPLSDRPHRYVFTLYALAVQDIHQAAGIPRTGTPALHAFALNKALGALMLEKVSLVATFGR